MVKIILSLLLTFSYAVAQEWKHFTTANSGIPSDLVYALVISPDNTIWVGTGNGLASLRGNVWTVYDTVNSPLPDPYITSLAVDSANTVWIGTGFAGAAKLANGNWTVYDTSNSDIPHNTIFDITIGPDQSPWFATEDGVVNFKDSVWKNYKNDLIEPQSRSVAFDHTGKLWMGTYTPVDFRGYIEYMKDGVFTHTILSHLEVFSTFARRIMPANDSTVFVATGNGLIKFVHGAWKVFRMQDSPLPANGVASLAIAGDTVIAGTASGIVEISGDSWNVILPSAGALPNDVVRSITVDRSGNRWLGMGSSGIAVYKKGGIVTTAPDERSAPVHKDLMHVYPNPFNPATTIEFTVPQTGRATLKVFNTLGQEVAILFDGIAEAEKYHRTSFDARNLSGGIYLARLQSGEKNQIMKMVLVK